ncbi:MAG: hypothetical protein JW937_07120 [Candidatus Omnitrophica bacterium]|nr:hypothetical protein [Candidatus Omnitrophota bacterium]
MKSKWLLAIAVVVIMAGAGSFAWAGMGHEDMSSGDMGSGMPEQMAKVCPVSGGPIGAMGKPYVIEYEGRQVELCCQGCEAEFRQNPRKYLTKLDAMKEMDEKRTKN